MTETKTLAGYSEWMKDLLTPVPGRHYVLKSFAMDEDRSTAVAAAEFHGAQNGTGGPVPPTGKVVVSDYAYVMSFSGNDIS